MRAFLLFLFGLFFGYASKVEAQNIFLKGKYVQLGIHPAGSFGSSVAVPSGYESNIPNRSLGFICDVDKDGFHVGTPKYMGDYFVPGAPEEGWGLEWSNKAKSGIKSKFANFGLMNEFGVSLISHKKVTSTARQQAEWLGEARGSYGKAIVSQTVTLDSLAQYFTINVLIQNTSTDTLFNVAYFRNVDPDNEQPYTNDFITNNYIQYQPGWFGNKDKAAVVAYGSKYKSPCILGSIDERAHVSLGGFSVRDVNDIFNFSDSTRTKDRPIRNDIAISIAFKLGHLPPGKCVTLAYYYALQDIDPNDIKFPVTTHFDISDDAFKSSQPFTGGNLCVKDTMLQFAVKMEGMGASFIDKVYWDADLDGNYELEGDTVEINFGGWKEHSFAQRLVFCDGSISDSTYKLKIEPKPVIQFSAQTVNPCFDQHEFVFENNSYWIKDSIQTFTWKFEGEAAYTGRVAQNLTFDSFSLTKSIKLVAETTIGCMDSSEITVNLAPIPTVNLFLNDSSQCLEGNRFMANLNGNIVDGTLAYQVRWGDGNTSDSNLVNHTYKEVDTFMVVGVATSDKGCITLDTQLIQVHPMPKANFTINDSNQCFPNNEFEFNNVSGIASGILGYQWIHGNILDTQISTKMVKTSSGDFSMKLVANSEFGCTDTMVKAFYVRGAPMAKIATNDTVQCLKGNLFEWSDQSTDSYGDLKINWSLRNDALIKSGSSTSLTHQFETPGNYHIQWIAQNKFGCEDTSMQQVVVQEQTDLSIKTDKLESCLRNNKFNLSLPVNINTDGLKVTWYLDAGEQRKGTFTERVSYGSTGVKTVNVITETTFGCLDTAKVQLEVLEMPSADFQISWMDSCVNSAKFELNKQDVFAFPVTRDWYVNNQKLNDGAILNYTFSSSDVVRSIVKSDKGCNDTAEATLTLYPPPKTKIKGNDVICLESLMNLTNNTDEKGLATRYIWELEGQTISEDKDLSYSGLRKIGINTVKLLAVNQYGCKHDTSIKVKLQPKSFVQIQTYQSRPCAKNSLVEFKAVNNNDAVGVVQNKWIWNDGRETSGNSVKRTGLKTGTHQVTLYTQNTLGCKDTLTQTFEVFAPLEISATANEVCVPQLNTFIGSVNADSDPVKRQIWQVAGQEFYGSPVQHNLKVPGIYDVRYIVETQKGCRDTLLLNGAAALKPKPKARFELDSFFSEGMGMTLQLKSTSSKDVDQWGWSFNDWEYSVEEHATFLFTDTGLVDLTLIVGNQYFCFDTTYQKMGPYFPIFYIHVPNAFTPFNGDDLNAGWKPFITPYLMKYRLEVYNRWGELMFKTDDPTESWDGTFNDKPVQEGVYVYTLFATDLMGDSYSDKGDITVLMK